MRGHKVRDCRVRVLVVLQVFVAVNLSFLFDFLLGFYVVAGRDS